MLEKIQIFIAWHLPKKIIKWATCRLGVYATTGKYSNQIVTELNFMEALRRWEN